MLIRITLAVGTVLFGAASLAVRPVWSCSRSTSKRLVGELRYEEGEPGELFPHVYGPINADAVVGVKRAH